MVIKNTLLGEAHGTIIPQARGSSVVLKRVPFDTLVEYQYGSESDTSCHGGPARLRGLRGCDRSGVRARAGSDGGDDPGPRVDAVQRATYYPRPRRAQEATERHERQNTRIHQALLSVA